jgi:hypothetical protein
MNAFYFVGAQFIRDTDEWKRRRADDDSVTMFIVVSYGLRALKFWRERLEDRSLSRRDHYTLQCGSVMGAAITNRNRSSVPGI